ncbi:unnamed protein product [Owenia fusiformis]|uniref:Globin domain-containing protein n=1 Tax=Owenia fusiformis TaxID=6347 RepID=A0A8S4PHU0_OWEFU|nr:unnamed protein product [Owenia fusiformis]
MGCQQTKTKVIEPGTKQNGAQNGGGDLNEPAAPPPTDDRLPLNARQIFRLQKSWKAIKRNMEDTGVEMFIQLFKNKAFLLDMFKNFKDLKDFDEMRQDESLARHAVYVMGIVDDAITKLHDFDYVAELITNTAVSHARFLNFKAEYFWYLEGPFLKAVSYTLQDRYTDQIAEIYTIALKFILQVCVDSYIAAVPAATTDDTTIDMNNQMDELNNIEEQTIVAVS